MVANHERLQVKTALLLAGQDEVLRHMKVLQIPGSEDPSASISGAPREFRLASAKTK